jgi:hypothetical protein
MIKKKEYFLDFIAIVIVISSYILGYYSFKYNQDFHHTGIQLSYLIDFKNGFKFFQEIYLQYGQGQTIFLFIIDKVFNINFFTIGIVVQLIYCLNLLLIYRIICLLTKKYYALLILFFIYLIHPYAVYSWPDYYSGLCLTLAAYFLLKNKKYNIFNYIFCSFLLFLSIFFRTSYLITIIPAFIFFLIFFKLNFFKYKINILLLFFILYLVIYFTYLNKNLYNWYYQGLGSITHYAYGSTHNLMGAIIDNFGENIWLFLKFLKMFFRFVYKLFNLFPLNNFIFTFFLLINLYYFFLIFFIKKNKKKINFFETKLIFLSFIGFFGFAQSFMIYATFKNINSTLGIFFLGVYILTKIKFSKNLLLIIRIIILSIVVMLMFKFPNVSNYARLITKNDGNFVKSEINIFSNSNLLVENNDYYKKLSEVICNQDKKIINLSFDYVIPYICNDNLKKYSMLAGMPFQINSAEDKLYKRIFFDHILFDDEMLITSKVVNSPNLKKIFEVDLPTNIMWYSMYDNNSNKIFVYTKS